MTTEIPRLVILDLYRNSLTTVERLSRAYKDRQLHAWAVKAKKECGELMVQLARDEMDEGMETEEEKNKKEDEDFYQ